MPIICGRCMEEVDMPDGDDYVCPTCGDTYCLRECKRGQCVCETEKGETT